MLHRAELRVPAVQVAANQVVLDVLKRPVLLVPRQYPGCGQNHPPRVRLAALDVQDVARFDNADDVIERRITRRPGSVRGIGADVLLAPTSLMETPDEWSLNTFGSNSTAGPRWVRAGTGVFAFPVLNVGLADQPINRDALE
jgi:hypothetical protein